MTSSDRISANHEDEIDLLALFGVLWSYKYLIGVVTIICALGAVAYALTATPFYRAEVVVTEVADRGMSNGGTLASQLGGLANLAGVNLSQGGADRESRAFLQSRRLVEEFIRQNNLVHELFPKAHKPVTLWQAVQKFQGDVLSIREDTRRGTITVGVEWTSPATSAGWANGFVALANELIRTRALEESKRNVAYLNDQAAQTNVIELRRVMYSLIEGETKTLMLANGRKEYAFAVVDPAVPPEIRARPYRTLIALLGTAAGLLIGVIVAFVHGLARTPKRAAVRGS